MATIDEGNPIICILKPATNKPENIYPTKSMAIGLSLAIQAITKAEKPDKKYGNRAKSGYPGNYKS